MSVVYALTALWSSPNSSLVLTEYHAQYRQLCHIQIKELVPLQRQTTKEKRWYVQFDWETRSKAVFFVNSQRFKIVTAIHKIHLLLSYVIQPKEVYEYKNNFFFLGYLGLYYIHWVIKIYKKKFDYTNWLLSLDTDRFLIIYLFLIISFMWIKQTIFWRYLLFGQERTKKPLVWNMLNKKTQ